MTWVRVDDQFARHPKAVAVGPLGVAMQVAALCYCNQYLTDGFVSVAAAATLQRFDNIDVLDDQEQATRISWRIVVADLVDAGLWNEAPGGWRIHDFEEYQPTKEQVLADREGARQRQLKLRKSRRDKNVTTAVSHGGSSEEVQGPRSRSSKELREQRRSKTNDDAVPPKSPETEARALVANGVITDPFELDLYDLEPAVRDELTAQLNG